MGDTVIYDMEGKTVYVRNATVVLESDDPRIGSITLQLGRVRSGPPPAPGMPWLLREALKLPSAMWWWLMWRWLSRKAVRGPERIVPSGSVQIVTGDYWTRE